MVSDSDHAMNNVNNNYCRFCCHADGTMLSFEEKRQDIVRFLVYIWGTDDVWAPFVAEGIMRRFPAWAEYGKTDKQ
jgi:hypothetical protein